MSLKLWLWSQSWKEYLGGNCLPSD